MDVIRKNLFLVVLVGVTAVLIGLIVFMNSSVSADVEKAVEQRDKLSSQLITPMRRFGKRYAEQRLGAVTVEADEGEFVAGASVSPTGPTSPIPTVRPPRGGTRVPYGDEDEGRRRPPSTIGREDRPAGGGAGSTAASAEDPVFKGESLAGDARVGMIWLVSVNDDGLELEPVEQADSQEGR